MPKTPPNPSVPVTAVPAETSPAPIDAGWNGILGVAVVVWTFLLGCTPLKDFDIWWHLRTGQLILERGTVPHVDWYTYSSADRPWIDMHWGFEVAAWLVFAAAGIRGLVLAKATVTAVAVGVAWWASGNKIPPWLKAGVWIVASIALGGRILERPETVSLLALSCWMAILGAATDHPKRLWLLPPLQLIWVNCHALFILGIVVGVLYLADLVIRRAAGGRFGIPAYKAPVSRTEGTIIIALVAASCFASPFGYKGALFPLELYRKLSTDQEFYASRITEFQGPVAYYYQHGFDTIYPAAALALLVIAVLTFSTLVLRGRIDPFRLLVFAAFSHLGFDQMRNMNLWALVTGMIVCWNLSELLGLATASAAESRSRAFLAKSALVPHLAALGCLLALMLSIVTGWWGEHPGAAWGNVFNLGVLSEGYYAQEAVAFAGRPGLPRRAFISHFGYASVYEFLHGPDAKVFMDPRLEVNTQQTYQTWERAAILMSTAGERSWEDMIRDEDGDLPVLVFSVGFMTNGIANLLQTKGWRMIYADDAAAVFATDAAADAAGLPKADARHLWWFESLPQSARDAALQGLSGA